MAPSSASAALPSAAFTMPATHPAAVGSLVYLRASRHQWCQEQEQRVGPKMRAPPDAVLASRAKKRQSMQPYAAFCRAERPRLPPSLSNSERERILGERWRASKAEKAGKSAPTRASTSSPTAYPAPGSPPPSRRPVPVQRPVHPVTPDRRVAFSAPPLPHYLRSRSAFFEPSSAAPSATCPGPD